MTEAAKNKVFSFRRRAENERDEELRALREGLIRTRTLINQAYVGFNGTGDPDLIESYVFEINSLQARYSYLPWLLVGLVAVAALLLLRQPIQYLARLCLRTLCSLAALAALSPLGPLIGVGLGVNLANALVMGLLGVPGFGLLLMLNWALAR